MAVPFPVNDLDVEDKLLKLAGSFWHDTYQRRDQVRELLFGRQQLEQDNFNRWQDTLAALNRQTVPVFRRQGWTKLTLRASERIGLGLPGFDGSWTFDVPSNKTFNEEPYLGFRLPQDLRVCRLLTSSIYRPAVSWFQGLDFDFDVRRQLIRFYRDPFTAGFPVQITPEDRYIDFWAPGAETEHNDLYRHFGIAYDVYGASSSALRTVLNALADGLADGGTTASVKKLLAAALQAPTAEATEPVTAIFRDSESLWIATATRTYRHARSAEPLVSVGDSLTAGEFMTNAVSVHACAYGVVPDALQALSISRDALGVAYFQGLVFHNEEVPLVVEEDVNGYTKVSFELGGFDDDVRRFFNTLHQNGVAAGQTLAMLLDTRGTAANLQPTAQYLPATINPLQFLVANVLRNNGLIVRIRVQATRGELTLKRQLKHLRKLVPAHVGLFVVVELAASGEEITMDDETVALRRCLPFADSLSAMTSTVRLRSTSGVCS